jgi:alkanesulfonate monooxygenase SsuD/methylene tetrahydromethanopterin reductase-like flavin-dependent oxidoreductase (luciferase family)
MLYENPAAMAENAAVADLIAAGRLQLGVSRGSPEPALNGPELFGNPLTDRQEQHDDARARMAEFRRLVSGGAAAKGNPRQVGYGAGGQVPMLPIQPQAPGLVNRLWWGAGSRDTAKWAGSQGYNLMSSTLLLEEAGIPFDEFQLEQINVYREAYKASGMTTGGRVSVSRSVMPLVTAEDHHYFGLSQNEDQVGVIDDTVSRFGRSYTGAPDVVAEELAADKAVQAADTLLITIPSQLGVAYNRRLMANIVEHVAPALGWKRKG